MSLVLSRKIGEAVIIDEHTRVCVSEITGNRVKLCIDAPESVRVLRDELVEDEWQDEGCPLG